MPVLFALFATLRGSPFADIGYQVDVEIFPREQIERIQPQVYTSDPKNIYVTDGVHRQIAAVLPAGNRLVVGEKVNLEFQSLDGTPLAQLLQDYDNPEVQPQWQVKDGENRVSLQEDGTLEALQPGKVTLEGKIPGLAANKGFLFIQALGRVGATGDNGQIHWDIVGMVLFFGLSLYLNQILSGQGQDSNANPQQQTISKLTPVIFSGMFLFFPLPAGVLMYMVVANIFQTLQTFILSREPLPENLQKIVDAQEKAKAKEGNRQELPFEPKRKKKPVSLEETGVDAKTCSENRDRFCYRDVGSLIESQRMLSTRHWLGLHLDRLGGLDNGTDLCSVTTKSTAKN